MKTSPGALLLRWWFRLAPLPLGKRLFSRLIGIFVPYSATIGARVLDFREGYIRLLLPDRRRVRNHLNSIHAIALVNFGEMCSGLALMSGMPSHVRGIVTHISIDYLKKARGDLQAQCDASFPQVSADMEHIVLVDIVDGVGEVVARVAVTWRLGLIA
ncbi:MAG: DUF4442 domain-containing protein [Gammaproteobacteria bacterium]|nr:DUF4442 domain-containing protein [Gammaproteobacteria bacterium]MDH5800342.1 DUF4442 domain-containing protein [Gammaproteobacteria bacterium]